MQRGVTVGRTVMTGGSQRHHTEAVWPGEAEISHVPDEELTVASERC